MFSIQKQTESGCEVCFKGGGYIVTVYDIPGRAMCRKCAIGALKDFMITEKVMELLNERKKQDGEPPIKKDWEEMSVDSS